MNILSTSILKNRLFVLFGDVTTKTIKFTNIKPSQFRSILDKPLLQAHNLLLLRLRRGIFAIYGEFTFGGNGYRISSEYDMNDDGELVKNPTRCKMYGNTKFIIVKLSSIDDNYCHESMSEDDLLFFSKFLKCKEVFDSRGI